MLHYLQFLSEYQAGISVDLTNSKRLILKASYVVTQLTPTDRRLHARTPGRGLIKVNHLRSLAVQPEDFLWLEHAIASTQDSELRSELERAFSASRTIAQDGSRIVPAILATNLAEVSDDAIIHYSKLVESLKHTSVEPYIAAYQQLLKVSPVGRLHLERMEMYPVGLEQGEMVFTVPLAPGETCTISHKEWSTSTDEFENIVDDFLESYSERGVAEKSDAAMSAESESRHSLALNFGASVSGGFGPVSMSTSFGLASTSEERDSIKRSTVQSREVTEKASARTRKEHKVSMKLESKKGAEDNSFRTIQNTFADRALRVDYFRMMRKWRTDLFRYGLRLTYDIPIPNPGARLWAKYRELASLDRELQMPFAFTLKPDDITEQNYLNFVAEFAAAIEPPPQPITLTSWKALTNINGGLEAFEFVAPNGYILASKADGRGLISDGDVTHVNYAAAQTTFSMLPSGFKLSMRDALFEANRSTIFATYAANINAMVELQTSARPSSELLANWRSKAWEILRAAAFDQYRQKLQRLQDRRDRLFMDLTSKDTLTLRRMEREEILRLAMDWIVGPSFSTSPANVSATLQTILAAEAAVNGAADLQSLNTQQWVDARAFGEFVKFVHEAVEWENLIYFLYPYFWGSGTLAKEKLFFDHPDSSHRDFLRAGYARVVIPIRPGFEKDFTHFAETGTFAGAVTSPYMTIADEVAAFSRTNYRGISPANPERHSRPLLYPQQRTTWGTMERAVGLIEQFKIDNNRYPNSLAELVGGPFIDAWGRPLVYMFPGSGNDYDLFSFGANGVAGGDGLDADISAAAGASLIASWFDYTPTSGLDIELTAKPAIVV